MEEALDLMRFALKVIGRLAFPPEQVAEIVGTGKQLSAFNLSDGTRTQRAICRKTGLDAGSLSRTVDRWVQAGVAFRMGAGKESCPLHLYPLPKSPKRTPARTRIRGKR